MLKVKIIENHSTTILESEMNKMLSDEEIVVTQIVYPQWKIYAAIVSYMSKADFLQMEALKQRQKQSNLFPIQ